MNKIKNHILFGLRIIIIIVLIQTLRFKFTAHPDSVYIFTAVGLEPYGRIGIGSIELIISLLLIFPKTIWLGSGLAVGVMGGAIIMHLTELGIVVNGDSGTLFYTALVTFAVSFLLLWVYRKDIPIIGHKL